MQSLIDYINRLDQDDRAAFEVDVGTSIGYLRKARTVGQLLGPELCVNIERATGGIITRRYLRPEDWHRIWPELVTADHPAPTEAAA
jgi:DNA-binding transcriptional regulator YdaS (Cro superfamily)